MADIAKIMRRLADEIEAEDAGEQTKKQEAERDERIAKLEAQLTKASPAEFQEAVEELSDEEWELIKAHRTGTHEPKAEPELEAEETKDEKRPRQRLTSQIPRIWSGADEPDHVEYLDEDGAVKVRPGRKKGVPYAHEITDIPDADDEEAVA